MYPVVPMNSRLISENDVVIGGHFFPKKVNCPHVVRKKRRVASLEIGITKSAVFLTDNIHSVPLCNQPWWESLPRTTKVQTWPLAPRWQNKTQPIWVNPVWLWSQRLCWPSHCWIRDASGFGKGKRNRQIYFWFCARQLYCIYKLCFLIASFHSS